LTIFGSYLFRIIFISIPYISRSFFQLLFSSVNFRVLLAFILFGSYFVVTVLVMFHILFLWCKVLPYFNKNFPISQ